MSTPIPASLKNDPRIDEIETNYGGENKWLIHLKPDCGWWFPSESHTRSFNTVAEYRAALRRKPK